VRSKVIKTVKKNREKTMSLKDVDTPYSRKCKSFITILENQGLNEKKIRGKGWDRN
jgi:hypothetical protein